SGVPLGLVTNGDQWMVVYAPPSETSGYASWYSTLWLEEQKTLAAFRTLLSLHRFFGVPDDQMLVPMLAESAAHQQEVTDQLGSQVRSAVEILIQSLDRADQDYGRELLADVPEEVLYEAALTVMMRLVFLFCAEERELLLLGDQLFDQHYAVSTLVAQLQDTADQHGEEILERRLDAWCRLLATFRAVYGGVKHDRMHLPAYSGNLFAPDRFPFLEGRKSGTSWKDTEASPLPINNRTVLHLLRSLQYLELHGEAQRLSFRALDIEQIGHVYEGLLDHTAKRATEPVLGLIGQKEPELPLSVLEEQRAKGDESLFAFLKKETGSTRKWENSLDQELDTEQSNRLRSACGNDEALFERVLPYAKLIRIDTFARPVVVRQGSVYVTAGTDRRSSGTHYTPRSLTEPIVQYTLEPLVYEGPAEGTPKEHSLSKRLGTWPSDCSKHGKQSRMMRPAL
ncbi:MAG: Eco57I restriction-modification methylase domain-containing protein, partial [Planctomycetales bacterium]